MKQLREPMLNDLGIALPVAPFVDTYSDCYVRTVAAILNYYGCPDPALCFGQNYAFFRIFPIDAPPVLRSRLVPLESYLKNLGVRRLICSAMDKEEAWERMRQSVAQGAPVLAHVDVYHIPYLPYYHKVHDLHNIIISGFDQRAKSVRIVDNVANYQADLPQADVFEAFNLSAEVSRQVSTEGNIHWQEFVPAAAGFQFQRTGKMLADDVRNSLSLWDQTKPLAEHLRPFTTHLYAGEVTRWEYGWQAIREYAGIIPDVVRALPAHISALDPPFIEYRWLSQQGMWFARYMQYCQTQTGHAHPAITTALEKIAQQWMIIQSVMIKYRVRPHPDVPARLEAMLVELAKRHAQLIQPLYELADIVERGDSVE